MGRTPYADCLEYAVWSMLSTTRRTHGQSAASYIRSRPRETVFFALKSSQRVVASYIGRAGGTKKSLPGSRSVPLHGYWSRSVLARRLGGPPLLMNELYYY